MPVEPIYFSSSNTENNKKNSLQIKILNMFYIESFFVFQKKVFSTNWPGCCWIRDKFELVPWFSLEDKVGVICLPFTFCFSSSTSFHFHSWKNFQKLDVLVRCCQGVFVSGIHANNLMNTPCLQYTFLNVDMGLHIRQLMFGSVLSVLSSTLVKYAWRALDWVRNFEHFFGLKIHFVNITP